MPTIQDVEFSTVCREIHKPGKEFTVQNESLFLSNHSFAKIGWHQINSEYFQKGL